MSRISETIEVDVPLRVAYDQWTQFETFPQFMEGIDRVIQLDDRTLDWTATIAGKVKHWRAEITDQEPDRLIAWRSIDGARNDGSVRFEAAGADSTRLSLDLDVDPEGPLETAGDALGFVARRAKADLERFKAFIEARGQETGAWRGSVGSRRS
ncbi:MAG: SRPBCC family protein [Chloroflexi bacterium]|nr:SRPBCC family protein [Chloroflexota bacterium]